MCTPKTHQQCKTKSLWCLNNIPTIFHEREREKHVCMCVPPPWLCGRHAANRSPSRVFLRTPVAMHTRSFCGVTFVFIWKIVPSLKRALSKWRVFALASKRLRLRRVATFTLRSCRALRFLLDMVCTGTFLKHCDSDKTVVDRQLLGHLREWRSTRQFSRHLIQTRGKMPFASSCPVLCGALRHLVAHGPIRAWPCPSSRSDLHIRDIVHHDPSMRFHETELTNIREKDAAACSQVKCGACLLCVSVFFYKVYCCILNNLCSKREENSFYARPFYPRLTVSKVTRVHN